MRIIFSYLQIDAMLKQLHINRDSEYSGLHLCSLHHQSTSSILLRDLSEITTGRGGGPLEATRVECEFRFSKSSKEVS